jgi:aldehyde dehydrogenase (NAD+)
VRAAERAFPAWRAVDPSTRRGYLQRLADLLIAHKPEFDTINAYELGVPMQVGSTAILTAMWFQYYAGWIDKIEGHVPTLATSGGFGYTRAEPWGVICAIVPFNGGLIDIGLKVAPALAAGNTVVIKPSELAPFAPILFAKLAAKAGIPDGVINVIQGGAAVGDALVRHRGIAKISFTGGGSTAQKVLRAAADRMTPVVTELGGKSANIIFPDADLTRALDFSCRFPLEVQAGQNCQKPSRLFVHRSIYKEALDRIAAIAESFVLGDPFESGTTMGPVISESLAERCVSMVKAGVAQGQGRLLTGGARLGERFAKGYFVKPTVVADVDDASALAQEEIFGPVLCVLPFDTEEEAIAKANDTPFGLSAYIQTRDLATAHRVAARLEAGMVNVNGFYNVNPGSPFGGYKTSGVGREGGRWGIEEFLQVKNVFIDF